ncbi:MAG: hypothetical protein IIC73_08315, partial [Armatimonadetes bacterium]|nr:hypothetical protein [Armatimonadota bacterium]
MPDGVTPETNRRYHKAYNAYLERGPFVPAFKQYIVSGTDRINKFATRAVDWTESGKKGINRTLYYGADTTLYKFSNGAEASVFTVANAVFVDLLAWEDGSSNGALICSYGSTEFLRRMADSGTPTASSDVKVGYMAMAGPDLYAQTDAGTYSTYKVSKLPKGNDPKTASNWGSGEPVGSAAYKITGLAGFDIGIAVGKEEGLFIFDEQEGIYRNLLPFLEHNPHPDNGKGLTAVAGGVIYPVHDGSLWFSDGFSSVNITPLDGAHPDRDTPKGKIVSIIEKGGTILAALDSVYQLTRSGNIRMRLFDDSASTFQNDDTNVTDNKLSTAGTDLAGFDDANDFWYIGADFPIQSIEIVFDTPNSSGTASLTVAYSTASGFTVRSIADLTHDGTRTFAKDGLLLQTAPFDMHTAMGKQKINGVSAYWWRLTVSGSAVTAGTKIAEVRVLYSRAAMAMETTDDLSGMDQASSFAHILAGIRTDRGIIWHDRYVLSLQSPVDFIALTGTDIGQPDNGGLALVVGGRAERNVIPLNATDDPLATVFPVLNAKDAGVPVAMVQMPRMRLSEPRFPDDPRPRHIERFDVEGEYLQAADKLVIGMRWDRHKWVLADTLNQLPGSARAPAGNVGHELDWWMALTDTNSTEHAAPRVNKVWAVWDYVGEGDKYP